MRLIDVDALLENQPKGFFRTLDWINAAPIIDAIPVEWLESKRKEALHEGMRPDEVEAVVIVLWMWKKEQEAQDAKV